VTHTVRSTSEQYPAGDSWIGRGFAAFHGVRASLESNAGGQIAREPGGFVRLGMAWLGLVTVIVVGRFLQPAWNVTPCTGAALVAGAIFPRALVAASVPLAGLLVSNLILPSYESPAMALVVFAATLWPVAMRGWVRPGRLAGIAAGSLAASVVFFLSTNVAFWWLSSDYPHTIGGLTSCFVAALPFFRWMPVGDLAWSAVLALTMAAIGHRLASVGDRLSAAGDAEPIGDRGGTLSVATAVAIGGAPLDPSAVFTSAVSTSVGPASGAVVERPSATLQWEPPAAMPPN